MIQPNESGWNPKSLLVLILTQNLLRYTPTPILCEFYSNLHLEMYGLCAGFFEKIQDKTGIVRFPELLHSRFDHSSKYQLTSSCSHCFPVGNRFSLYLSYLEDQAEEIIEVKQNVQLRYSFQRELVMIACMSTFTMLQQVPYDVT